MKRKSIAKIIAAGAIAALCAFGIAGCSSNAEDESIPDELKSDTGLTGGIAATVNGVEIEEDKVTRAINNTRINYGYTEESEWKDYLKNRKYTVESMRYEVIGQLVNQELVKQCADQRGATTDDEEIQSYVEKVSSQYSSEEAWQKAVDDSGWDNLDAYKEALHFSILEKKLKDGFEAEAEDELSGSALVEKLAESAPSYDGAKKTSHILFKPEDEELAQEVRNKIVNGEMSFEDAVAEYSTDEGSKEDGGNVGWDKLNSFVEEYTEAIANLGLNEISAVTESKYGYHIITVTDVWNMPQPLSSASQVPDEIVDTIKENSISTNSTTAYEDWLNEMRGANDIQINPMPENVPYYVDMSDVYSEEEAKQITDKALNYVITGIEEVATDTSAAEAEDALAAADASDEGNGVSPGDAALADAIAETDLQDAEQAAEAQADGEPSAE